MAKVHPFVHTAATSTVKREVFTIWMKSLVMQGHGCTAFNEDGEIVYRVDNYDNKCSNEVYLMDLRGKVLFTILRRKLRVFGCWEGYKCDGSKDKNEKPWFEVRKNRRIIGAADSSCQIIVGPDKAQASCYRLEGLAGKSAFKIVDSIGRVVAEAKRKSSTSGVVLGDDVMSLEVEANIDHSLIMALVTVYGLICHKM